MISRFFDVNVAAVSSDLRRKNTHFQQLGKMVVFADEIRQNPPFVRKILQ
ncbi:hypothetical protein J4E05_20535 [Thalassospira sp. NFXS8]